MIATVKNGIPRRQLDNLIQWLENRDFMLEEMDVLLQNLQAYRNAIADNSFDDLRQLLQEGKEIKEQVDGR